MGTLPRLLVKMMKLAKILFREKMISLSLLGIVWKCFEPALSLCWSFTGKWESFRISMELRARRFGLMWNHTLSRSCNTNVQPAQNYDERIYDHANNPVFAK